MRVEFKLPDIGEGVMEGEIVAWHVKEGDQVGEDQIMVEVMTDKATVTIGAPKPGKIEEVRAQVGSTVKVGEVLVVIQTGNGSRAHGGHPSKMPAASAVGDIQESLPGASYFAEKRAKLGAAQGDGQTGAAQGGSPSSAAVSGRASAAASAKSSAALGGGASMSASRAAALASGALSGVPSSALANEQLGHFSEKPLATPATRKLARDLGLDLRQVPPTGPRGRVTNEDVHAASSGAGPAMPARSPRSARRQTLQPAADRRLPFVGVRRLIAERMQQSKNTAAHFTFVEECDASRLMSLREKLKPEAAARGTELTYMPFIVKAVCTALKKNPMLNSSLDVENNELVLHGRCNIGIAAATEQGLVVPVIHGAEELDLFEIATEVNRLAAAARDGKLSLAELSGSTFTITSLGKQAGLLAVPILNFPNVGILGVHRIKERPVVRDGQIAIGQIMLLSLSLDHRIVDGHVGAAFAYDVIACLEEPALMFIGA
jgi:pyruvate dehydrogenase E2 component (dihydrolipoamide acetyltransferase)